MLKDPQQWVLLGPNVKPLKAASFFGRLQWDLDWDLGMLD